MIRKPPKILNTNLLIITLAVSVSSQQAAPEKIRGYKVEQRAVEASRPQANYSRFDQESLISFGNPSLARVTPLGITFEVPIVVAPVRQSGRVDFLIFENVLINEHSVDIQEYHHSFNLPLTDALSLRDPLRIYIYLPTAMMAAVGEWTDSKETWPVSGRVFVCGKFKKSIFSFKRCVPVELNLTMRNPLRSS